MWPHLENIAARTRQAIAVSWLNEHPSPLVIEVGPWKHPIHGAVGVEDVEAFVAPEGRFALVALGLALVSRMGGDPLRAVEAFVLLGRRAECVIIEWSRGYDYSARQAESVLRGAGKAIVADIRLSIHAPVMDYAEREMAMLR